MKGSLFTKILYATDFSETAKKPLAMRLVWPMNMELN